MRYERAAAKAALAGLSLVIAGVAQAQSAAGQDWPATLAAAQREGRVVFYSAAPNPVVDRLIAGFGKLHPDIAVEAFRTTSGALIAKVDQERASGMEGADVILATEAGWLGEQMKAGRLLKVAGPDAEAWPKKFLQGDSLAIVGSDPFVILYNTSLVPNPPKTYADLLRPEYKNRMGATELASTVLVAFYDWLEKTQGADYLTRFKALNPKLYNGSTPGAQAVASGEVALNLFGIVTVAKPLQAQGAPIGYVIPDPCAGNVYGLAVPNWTKRKEAALVFEDYVMSMAGQTAWHGGGQSASPLPGVPGALSMASLTILDQAAYPPDVAKTYTEHWNKIFK
jgi:iron(III) transport system substrate-binding protein